MLFSQWFHDARRRSPDKLALVCGDCHYTYAELDDATDAVATSLAAAGIRPDDRVAFFLPNCAELVLSYLACFKLGAVAVPLNHRYRRAEAEYAIAHSGSTALVVHQDKWADVADIDFATLGLEKAWFVGEVPADKRLRPFESLLAGGRPPEPAFDHHQLATIMYTSGTTARPKGVVHSQQTMAHCVEIQSRSMQFTADDVLLVSTSASHCAATFGLLLPNFYVGGTAVMLHAPTAAQVAAAIAEYRVTRCQMLPPGLLELVEYLEEHRADVSSLRSFLTGGDVVPLDTQHRFRKLTGWDVSELCGMTETITYVSNSPFGEKRLGSVGRPLHDTQVKIVDEHGADVATGETGEIMVRSPANMVGYWNDTLHTAATLRDGWLASGDLGRLDAEGYLWFVGRKKEIIVHGGSNISPLEIEEVIDAHPAVHASGVVGRPDRRWGQVVVAYVELRDHAAGPPPGEADLRAFVAERISAYKVPERFIFLPQLPLSPTGKVDRRQLHARVENDVAIKEPAE